MYPTIKLCSPASLEMKIVMEFWKVSVKSVWRTGESPCAFPPSSFLLLTRGCGGAAVWIRGVLDAQNNRSFSPVFSKVP